MKRSGLRRRAVLVAISGSGVSLTGCSYDSSDEPAAHSGYGTAYGRGYETD